MSQTKAQLIDPTDGSIVNADINASAAIAGTKISPDFGSQNIVTTGETTTSDVFLGDSILHTGDTNTKIRFPAADTVSIEAAGSEALRVDSSGRLLIGDTSSDDSTSMIQVKRANNSTIRVASSDATVTNFAAIDFAPANSVEGASIMCVADGTMSGSSNQDAHLRFSTVNNGTSAEAMRIDKNSRVGFQGAATRAVLDVRASGGNNTMLTAVFGANEGQTGGSLSDNADKAARVGSYHYDLDEEPFGVFVASGSNGVNALSFGGGTSLMNAATEIKFFTASNSTTTNGSERMRITADGPHLLLGGTADVNEITESSANAGMVIGGTGFGNAGLAIITSTSGTGRLYFGDNTGSDAGRNRGQINYGHSDDHMRFVTASSERMRIDSSGKVNVGGTTSDSKFVVIDSSNPDIGMRYNGTSGGHKTRLLFIDKRGVINAQVANILHNDGVGTAAADLEFATATGGTLTARLKIDQYGTSTFTQANSSQSSESLRLIRPNATENVQNDMIQFECGGQGRGKIVSGSSDGSAPQLAAGSDYRMKENIRDYTQGYENIKSIPVKIFDMITDGAKDIKGWIAHEVQPYIPEAVLGVKDAVVTQAMVDSGERDKSELGDDIMQSLAYGAFMPDVVGALQTAIAKIEVLETEVAALKAA